jgi:hypothetical protein
MSTLKEKRQAKKELGAFFLLPIGCVDLHHFGRILEGIFESRALAALRGNHQDRFSTQLHARVKFIQRGMVFSLLPAPLSQRSLQRITPPLLTSFEIDSTVLVSPCVGAFALWRRQRPFAFKNPSI